MKRVITLLCAVLMLHSAAVLAQTRYLDPVFSTVNVQTDVVYGQNISQLKKLAGTGPGEVIDLKMDVYTPQGDTATNRPLIIYLHTGSFLPVISNGNATGSFRDSTAAEMCRQFAKKGYVAASIAYRVGWNPYSSDQNVRTGTLLRAVYRAVQDTRTAIRFFKKNADLSGNDYGIDTTRIIVCGQGSGGYVAFAAASLDKQSEAEISKFLDFSTGVGVPAANPDSIGDVWGLGGVADTSNPKGGNIENHPGYSSEISMMIEFGGAMGDISWLEAGDVPMVAAHVPGDPFAPYADGPVIVPSFLYFVVDVSGPKTTIDKANDLGNNDVLNQIAYNDVYTQRADQVNEGIKHLFPMIRPVNEAGPWDWWNQNDVPPSVNTSSLNSNPDMSKTKALRYIDSLQGYFAPRLVQGLFLQGDIGLGAGDTIVLNDSSIILGAGDSIAIGANDTVRIFSNGTEIVFIADSTTTLNIGDVVQVSGSGVVTVNGTVVGQTYVPVGIKQDPTAVPSVNIYPNPSTDNITIDVKGSQLISQVSLFDISGKLIQSLDGSGSTVVVNRNGLSTGIYFVNIRFQNGQQMNSKVVFE